MDYLADIVLAYAAYLVATVSPGPAIMAIMVTSAGAGRRAGLRLASGILAGSVLWGIAAALGLSIVMSHVAWVLTAFKIVGGCYLLWLALKSLKSALSATPVARPTPPGSGSFARGLALHLTNPKAVLAWAAIITLGLRPDAPPWVAGAILLGCALLGTIVFGTYAVVFSTDRMMRLYRAARRPIEGAVAALFGMAGMKLLMSRA